MATTITKKQLEELVKEIIIYKKNLNENYPDNKNKYVKSIKEFLIDKKVDESINELLSRENEFKIDVIVVESGNENILVKSKLLLEWEQYKGIPKTNLYYRYDKGNGKPGFEDHIHVYLDNNHVYAINRSGKPHDGSVAKLSNKEIKFLKGIGFTPPSDGILEWKDLDKGKEYIGYKRQLLLD